MSDLGSPPRRKRVDLCIQHPNFSEATQRTSCCLNSLDAPTSLHGLVPKGRTEMHLGLVDTTAPHLAQHSEWTKTTATCFSPKTELKEDPGISGQADRWGFSPV